MPKRCAVFLALGLAVSALQGCASARAKQRSYAPEDAAKMVADITKRTGVAEHAVDYYPVVVEALRGTPAYTASEQSAVNQELSGSARALGAMRAALPAIQGQHLDATPASFEALMKAAEPWNQSVADFSDVQKKLLARFKALGIRDEDVAVLHYDGAFTEAQMAAEEAAVEKLKACPAIQAQAADFAALGERLKEARAAKNALDQIGAKLARSQAAPGFVALKPQDPNFQGYKSGLAALKKALKAHRTQKATLAEALQSCP